MTDVEDQRAVILSLRSRLAKVTAERDALLAKGAGEAPRTVIGREMSQALATHMVAPGTITKAQVVRRQIEAGGYGDLPWFVDVVQSGDSSRIVFLLEAGGWHVDVESGWRATSVYVEHDGAAQEWRRQRGKKDVELDRILAIIAGRPPDVLNERRRERKRRHRAKTGDTDHAAPH